LNGYKDKDEIKTLLSVGDKLISAGKGSSQSHALLIWDLRNTKQPLDKKELN